MMELTHRQMGVVLEYFFDEFEKLNEKKLEKQTQVVDANKSKISFKKVGKDEGELSVEGLTGIFVFG